MSLVCAVASHGDADRHLHDSQIPPPANQPSKEDIQGYLLEVFKLADTNDDKQLDGPELASWLTKVHNEVVKDNIDQQWNYYVREVQEVHSWDGYEPEKRETLTWEQYVNSSYPAEVIALVNNTDADVSAKATEDPDLKAYVITYQRAVARWNAADQNNDDVLVKSEFKFFVHPEEGEHTKHILVDEAMGDMDHNSDGEVGLSEYIKHMVEVQPEDEASDPNFRQVT